MISYVDKLNHTSSDSSRNIRKEVNMADLMSVDDLSFAEQFSRKAKAIDAQYGFAKPIEPRERKEIPLQEGPLFNLHKRSLPTGIDKIVEMGLTKREAIEALLGRCKTSIKNDILIYHDIIAQNASDEEMSIYFNTKEVIREDVR